MSEQEKLANRIKTLCSAKDMSYYTLSYRSAVPMTTLMHIIDCSTQNPGIFTICNCCGGLVSIKRGFDSPEFLGGWGG